MASRLSLAPGLSLLNFFFYGTLIAGSANQAARAAHARLRPVGRASVPGALWAIPDAAGWYPALIPGPGGPVHGVVYAAAAQFDRDDLAGLDRWEDYRPDALAGSLYRRRPLQIVMAGRNRIAAQAYCFNQPVPADACAIPQGDFRAWLAARGFAAYGA